jgi:hypothetical protein
MMKYKFITLILAMSLLAGVALAGQPIERNKASLQKTSVNDVFAPMDINNIFSYYKNNGDGSLNPYTGDGGFEIISAKRGITVFEEGLVYGGFHAGTLKVGGSTYSQGWQAGRIITPAVVANGVVVTPPVASDPADPKNRLYRVRPDVKPGVAFADVQASLEQEIALYAKYDSRTTAQSLYDGYVADWKDWPADQGAPYKDVNGNGKYDNDGGKDSDIPGVPGADQTMWYVVNDLDASRTVALYGSDPIGMEMQKTIWAYRLGGALGNTIFQKNKLINKSGLPIDSMFVGQWADCDNGGGLGYKDDFTGCDSTLGLGFTYNGTNNDGFFGSKPPAIGFDFFQGPIIKSSDPNDRAIFNGGYRYGYKNLNMTGFNFFINSNNLYRDPTLNNPKGAQEMYNLLNGMIVSTGGPNINPITGQATKFALSGDPVTGKGWIDGVIAGPDDRRQICTSGPFKMAASDTQEVVVAELAAQGFDRLSSVSLLKYYDRLAQSAYDQFFELPKPPAQPIMTATGLDHQVVLDWSSFASVQAVEVPAPKGYAFEGYNVYQTPGAGFENAKLLATYDVKDGVGAILDTVYSSALGSLVYIPVQNGDDKGIARYFNATKDYINDKPFVNGQTYYFAVSAYNLNQTPGASPVTLESAPIVLPVIPQSTAPGVRLGSNAADTTHVIHTAGVGDGIVTPIVLDPLKLTGDTYKVTFDTLNGETVWFLTDVTKNKVLLANQTNLSGDDSYSSADGFFLKVQGPPPGMKGWTIPAGTRVWSWAGGNTFGLEGFNGSPDVPGAAGAIGNAYAAWFTGGVSYDKLKNVLIKFAATDADGNLVDPNDPNASYAYRYLRGATTAAAKPEFAPFIINKTAGYAFQDFKKNFPFAAYDAETTPPRRLAVGHLENNSAGGLVDGKYWPGLTTVDNVASTGPREWFFIYDVDYAETVNPLLNIDILNNETPMMWMGTPSRRNATAWAAGNEFLLQSNHIATKADVYTFTPSAPVTTVENGKVDVQKINVFPNPYFGFNSKEPNKYNRFVTFNHLPKTATINIINLAGVRVRTLLKTDDTQFINWDLKNTSGLPVAAGVYIVYIDMGDLGTKIVKLSIIPEAQQLDRY